MIAYFLADCNFRLRIIVGSDGVGTHYNLNAFGISDLATGNVFDVRVCIEHKTLSNFAEFFRYLHAYG